MEKIDQILESLYDRVIEPVEAKEQLLLLFGVMESDCGNKFNNIRNKKMKDKDIVDEIVDGEIVDGEMDKYLQKLKDKDPMWDQKVEGKKLMQPADESNSGGNAGYTSPVSSGVQAAEDTAVNNLLEVFKCFCGGMLDLTGADGDGKKVTLHFNCMQCETKWKTSFRFEEE